MVPDVQRARLLPTPIFIPHRALTSCIAMLILLQTRRGPRIQTHHLRTARPSFASCGSSRSRDVHRRSI
ncbi:hypothetical protein BD311DRAFT_771293 [Dichomitus squalens]|uniref:Uncharacterized protein n=1 Tax=Dichomitus squalens TaxID=114155 RepID=A0A4Q9M4V8_9APHY|nr:hypothetical protein BD311DRAFT_771293 [Dichomitus squalens]